MKNWSGNPFKCCALWRNCIVMAPLMRSRAAAGNVPQALKARY